MDASLLLHNIHDALFSFNNDQQKCHSLHSSSPKSDIDQPTTDLKPSISAYATTKNISKHKHSKHNHSHTHSTHKHHRKAHHRSSKHRIHHSHITIKPSSTMIGPHQTFIIKDKQEIQQTDHKNSVPSHISTIHEIPSFVIQNTRRLQLLKEMIEIKRSELERVSNRHNNTISSIIELYIHAANAINSLRKQYRQLSLFAEQLSREGKKRNTISDKLLQTLHNIEEQRKLLLNKIDSPAWEIKHHFHILSFEHFRGNQQPHLLEIAEVLPSRLQIAAIAHSSSIKNDRLLMRFHIARKERDLLFKKLGEIDNKRNLTQAHLKDYKKMMTIIRKNIGENRLQKLRKERENYLENENAKFSHYSRFRKSPIIHPSKTPSISPVIGDEFRLNYLRHIGIQAKKKIEFDLSVFVIEVNNYLGIAHSETKLELNELKNVSNLINPITGQVRNPTEVKNESIDVKISVDLMVDKKKKKKKIKHKLIMKEKQVRQNILSVIDHNIFNVVEEVKDGQKMFYVSLRNSTNVEKKENNLENDDDDDIPLQFPVLMHKKTMDEPHSDWSVLAKHLKDSSKQSARRKQILKQLERILHVREGLSAGFERLKTVFESYENKQIEKK